ncbi:unnamed protein product [Didymodactylos carnosus]|uniref:Uncharacterized protein n=1 Tax=Didymodactylos carnosus TaxID=1234261 RepID=A0A814L6G2_9BILA|nr:unnamed protein product [Didymodactylos carnosus]CAF3829937.1 unnamed protein product [Didymodactylos carnosus]
MFIDYYLELITVSNLNETFDKVVNTTLVDGKYTIERIWNGPLRSNTVYKVLIDGCTSSNLIDWTYVLSTAFKTMSPIIGKIEHFIL